MRIFSIDWGKKRIGLASSDGDFAEPLGVVGSVEELIKIAKIQKVGKFILGLPEGRQRRKVKELGRRLEEELGVKVIFRDEVLSTKTALKAMIESGKKKKARRELDAITAALLLQEYLDSSR